jgi:sulfur-oxidizing protein SoxX
MRQPIMKTLANSALAALLASLTPVASAVAQEQTGVSAAEQGKAIAWDRKKGNCLACHVMDDGELPGNIGPPLVAMKARFPNKAALRAQIWDATKNNPNTMMPPFGRHGILTEGEIDLVVVYVYTL